SLWITQNLFRVSLKVDLYTLEQGHLEWLNFEEILSLIKSGFELGHETILPEQNASAKFEVIAKSDISCKLEIIRGAGFVQNIDFYRGEQGNLRTACSSLKMPGRSRTQIQLEISLRYI
ncbi:MAG: hypothetical protein WA672_21075, partial [Candidatus Angelobacter sp.]